MFHDVRNIKIGKRRGHEVECAPLDRFKVQLDFVGAYHNDHINGCRSGCCSIQDVSPGAIGQFSIRENQVRRVRLPDRFSGLVASRSSRDFDELIRQHSLQVAHRAAVVVNQERSDFCRHVFDTWFFTRGSCSLHKVCSRT